MLTPSQDTSDTCSTNNCPGYGDGSVRCLFTNVNAGVKGAWLNLVNIKDWALVARIIHIVHKGAKKLRIKAYPFGHPLTGKGKLQCMPCVILSRLTIGKVTQCITCWVFVLVWRRSWECNDYRDTKPERTVGAVIYPYGGRTYSTLRTTYRLCSRARTLVPKQHITP